MSSFLEAAELTKNPFPPAATGMGGALEIYKNIYLPKEQSQAIEDFYCQASQGSGVKVFPIIGAYGAGKSAVLKGYMQTFFESKNIKVFYFDNPGVEFYSLAESMMRALGRYEFSKGLFEFCKQYILRNSLFETTFEDVLADVYNEHSQDKFISELEVIILKKLELTDDEEIAHKLACIIVDTYKKRYFERKDFMPSNAKSVVSENHEDKFFHAIISAIIKIYNVDGVAFLIDEFEEITFSKGMTKAKTYEYLSTFRRLIDLSEKVSLWVAVAMTPEALEQTKAMNNALIARFVDIKIKIELNPFASENIVEWLKWWLNTARVSGSHYHDSIFPFPKEFAQQMAEHADRCYPRKLVKTCFAILADAAENNLVVPLSPDYTSKMIKQLFEDDTNYGK